MIYLFLLKILYWVAEIIIALVYVFLSLFIGNTTIGFNNGIYKIDKPITAALFILAYVACRLKI